MHRVRIIQWLHVHNWSHAIIALIACLMAWPFEVVSHTAVGVSIFYYSREMVQAGDEMRPWRWSQSGWDDFYRPLVASTTVYIIYEIVQVLGE